MVTKAENNPLVTIAIPTFNRANMLKKAISSALNQSFEKLEVLIVDNASSDETQKTVSNINDSRVRYIKNSSNIGLSANWQKCVHHASGDYLLMLSDDDILMPNAISTLLKPYIKGIPSINIKPSSVSLSIGRSRILSSDGSYVTGLSQTKYLSDAEYIINSLKGKIPTYPSSILMRLKDVKDLGGFCIEKYEFAIDVVLASRLASLAGVAFDKNIVANYREHDEATTNNLSISSIINETMEYSNLCEDLILQLKPDLKASDINKLLINFRAKRTFNLILKNYGGTYFDKVKHLFRVKHYAKTPISLLYLIRSFSLALIPNDIFKTLRNFYRKSLNK